MEKVFRVNQMFYPVPISEAPAAPIKGFPWIRPRDFIYTMHLYGDLGHILAGFGTLREAKELLRTFWTRYRQVAPGFELFKQCDNGQKQMEECVPLYIHGDEGISYKKSGVLILSFQSCMGVGASKRHRALSINLEQMGESGLPLNFLRAGMSTRMLMIMCQKEMSEGKNGMLIGVF